MREKIDFKKEMEINPDFKEKVLQRRSNKKGKRQKKKGENFIKSLYKRWKPVTDLKRSFFIWQGMYSNSMKEKEISVILKDMNLRYYAEVSFDMVKRFDFYIPLIDLVIEYDGQQHFTDLKQIENDKIKEKQLERLGIKLIRYNKKHDLHKQIKYDLIHHPVLNKKGM